MVINNFQQPGTLTCATMLNLTFSVRFMFHCTEKLYTHWGQELSISCSNWESSPKPAQEIARVLWYNLLVHIHSSSWPKGKFFPFCAEVFGWSSGLVDFFGMLEAQRVIGVFLPLGQAVVKAAHALHHHLHLLQSLLLPATKGQALPRHLNLGIGGYPRIFSLYGDCFGSTSKLRTSTCQCCRDVLLNEAADGC